MRVIDPDGAALLEGHEAKLLAKAWDEVKARLEVRQEVVVGGGRPLERHRRGDVHVRAVALEVEKRRVEACEAVGHERIISDRRASDPRHTWGTLVCLPSRAEIR